MEALRASLDAVCDFRPDLVLVSAGFDAYAHDPLTEMTPREGGFRAPGQVAPSVGAPAAAVLEGGYSPDLPSLVAAFLSAWAE